MEENEYTLKQKVDEIMEILNNKPSSFFQEELFSQEDQLQKLRLKFISHGFGVKYFNLSLNKNQQEIFDKICIDKKSFYLAGNYGTGKTALLHYIGQKIVKRYNMPSVLYTTTTRLIDSIKEKDKSIEVQHLFIDDLGFENFGLNNINYFVDFLRKRYSCNSLTFISSNLKLQDLKERNSFYYQIYELLSDKSFMTYYELRGENLRK